MKILAYQLDLNSSKTGKEHEFDSPTLRSAGNFICSLEDGCRMGYNSVVYQGQFKRLFKILEK